MPNTIILKGRGIRKERVAGDIITPGMLVEVTTTDTVVTHVGAGLNATKAFAVENEVIGGDIDTDYPIGDNVLYNIMEPGAEINALITGTTVIGGYLESDGAGNLRPLTTDVATDDTQRASVVAIALQAITNGRCKVEIV